MHLLLWRDLHRIESQYWLFNVDFIKYQTIFLIADPKVEEKKQYDL